MIIVFRNLSHVSPILVCDVTYEAVKNVLSVASVHTDPDQAAANFIKALSLMGHRFSFGQYYQLRGYLQAVPSWADVDPKVIDNLTYRQGVIVVEVGSPRRAWNAFMVPKGGEPRWFSVTPGELKAA